MDDIEQRLMAFHCPRWEELPDVELYADQAVNYIERHLSVLDVEGEGHLITSSMINNYVKMKLIPAPIRKKYDMNQLARLIVICSLKRDFSISELSAMTDMVMKKLGAAGAYNLFCEEMELNIRHAFSGEVMEPVEPRIENLIVRAVMTAFANKLLAHWAIRACAAAEDQTAEIGENLNENPIVG